MTESAPATRLVTACPVCGGTTRLPVLRKGGYSVYECTQCNVQYVFPIPADEVLQAHYSDPRYFSGSADQGYYNYADVRKALVPQYRRRLRTLAHHRPGRGSLLDFGCAAGYFLAMARQDGWRIAGVEVAPQMAQAASNTLQIPIARSLDRRDDMQFDAVTLWEVVEHLPRPMPVLRRLRDCLKPGGVLMLSTPNAGHWQAAREPESWNGYRPPSHLLFFKGTTLTDVLERAGFERITVRRLSPLPPLPAWVRRASTPLQISLATGQARPWPPALLTWRVIRLMGWGWHFISQSQDDIFTTLEATAFRPG